MDYQQHFKVVTFSFNPYRYIKIKNRDIYLFTANLKWPP
jgi:hypothetical protein